MIQNHVECLKPLDLVFVSFIFFFFSDSQNASSSSVCPLSFVVVLQGLFTSLLALINSLVMLIIVPQLQHGSGVHRVLVYLDPSFSLLAVTVLIATTAPQVVTDVIVTFTSFTLYCPPSQSKPGMIT